MSISLYLTPNKLSHACGFLVITIMVTKRPWTIYQHCIRFSDVIIFSSDVQWGMALRVYLLLKITEVIGSLWLQRDHAY